MTRVYALALVLLLAFSGCAASCESFIRGVDEGWGEVSR